MAPKKKQNPEDALAMQIAAELGLTVQTVSSDIRTALKIMKAQY